MKRQLLNFQNIQTIKSAQVTQYHSKRPQLFYFFIENEFICQSDCNLFQNEYSTKYLTTVNLIKLSRDVDPIAYKIYYDFSKFELCKSDMKELYKQIGQYVQENFVSKDVSSFIGCVRDDNETHQFCTEKDLKFKCTTDPVHDVFNILKNIYVISNNSFRLLNYDNGNDSTRICYKDFEIFINKHSASSLPKVGYFNSRTFEKSENLRKIWMPNRNIQLETFIKSFRCLFKIKYYNKIFNIFQENESYKTKFKEAFLMLKLILVLQNIYEMQNQCLNQKDILNLNCLLKKLRHFKFENKRIRCLENLKNSIQTNLKTFMILNASCIKFKPSYFSTQLIEAEKGYLRYRNCSDLPTESQCKNWFKHVQTGTEEMELSSEFGRVKIKFEKLPVSEFKFRKKNRNFISKIEGSDIIIYDLYWSHLD